ncbi:DNA glycosylase [Hypomontagnella submonticulosa]|nr:DNA glycosylase [Hypomontagnella submonticulosa]
MAAAGVKLEAHADRPVGLRRSARNASKEMADVPVKAEDSSTNVKIASTVPARRKRTRVMKQEEEEEEGEEETKDVKPPVKRPKKPASSPSKRVKTETPSPRKAVADIGEAKGKETKEAGLRAKKLKSYAQFANKSPFPDFPRPTPAECQRAYDILAAQHGERQRPEKVSAPADRAGCGDSPSVLDALVRTILSQNTSNKNSTRAKLDMDAVYGSDGDSEARWEAIASGGAAKLESAIARGGLGGVKSRVIVDILNQVKERHGAYSLDHLLSLEAQGADEDAMRELISFRGVGPKTASCVLLFCVGCDSFAVDTHVHRITGMMGWRPASASRDEAFAHLDANVPDRLKYGLHVLLVERGRKCAECKAGGKKLGQCELRKVFTRGGSGGGGGERVGEELELELEEEEA